MNTNSALDQIKARVEGLSNLCPEYMHLAIRNSVRNCDFYCQAHGEEEECGPGQSDGARIAHSLADVPKLLAALEAVQEAADAEVQKQRKETERQWARLKSRHPDSDYKTADRQEASTAGAERVANLIRRAIEEALR